MVRFELAISHIWRLDETVLRGPNAPFWPAWHYLRDNGPDDLATEEAGSDDGLPDDHLPVASPGVNGIGSDIGSGNGGQSSGGVDRAMVTPHSLVVWVRYHDLRCGCPDLQLGVSYLLVMDLKSFNPQMMNSPVSAKTIASSRGLGLTRELLLDSKSSVLPWRPGWRRRLARLQRREQRGDCDRFRDQTARLRRVYRPSLAGPGKSAVSSLHPVRQPVPGATDYSVFYPPNREAAPLALRSPALAGLAESDNERRSAGPSDKKTQPRDRPRQAVIFPAYRYLSEPYSPAVNEPSLRRRLSPVYLPPPVDYSSSRRLPTQP